jgi:predicted transcriptional regulator
MEIYIDILKAVTEGREKPTHIMYRANLTWTRLKKHLVCLVDLGLIKEDQIEGATLYTVTSKGRNIIEYSKNIERELYYNKRYPSKVYLSSRL